MSEFNEVAPVTLPPGRLRLATRPRSTGSVPEEKTIGMVAVAAFAATAAAVLPGVAINATLRRIRSAAIAGSSSFLPEAQRYSMATFWPSIKPASASPLRKAATRLAFSSGDPACRNPITGTAGCCARAASGHAAAAPNRVMNWRRFMMISGSCGFLVHGNCSTSAGLSFERHLGLKILNFRDIYLAKRLPRQHPCVTDRP